MILIALVSCLPLGWTACGADSQSDGDGGAGSGGGAGIVGLDTSAASGGQSGSGGVGGSGAASGVGGSAGASGTTGSGGSAGAASGGSAGASPSSGPIGWASVNADGQDGTYGGRDGPVVEVTTLQELTLNVGSSNPRTLRVTGEIVSTSRLNIGSNKTIIGAPGAVLRGFFGIYGVQNVILQNLTIRGNDCDGSTTTCGTDDAIAVFDSHHVWLDHLDIADGSDGNLDITQGASYVTVSYCKFSYRRTDRPHRFSNLIGAADNVPMDQDRLKVTHHHNWWADNVNQRAPRTRAGQIHVFNNLFTSTGNSYCSQAGVGATLLVENNVYRRVNNPHLVDPAGNLLAVGNLYESTTGSRDSTGVGFTPPYPYTLDPTAGLADSIQQQVGPK
jgi:pectate lyase